MDKGELTAGTDLIVDQHEEFWVIIGTNLPTETPLHLMLIKERRPALSAHAFGLEHDPLRFARA
jgi:hypothetical protein